MSDEQCKAMVYRAPYNHDHQCTRKAWKDGYCKQHHPDSAKERQRKSQERFDKRQAKIASRSEQMKELRKELSVAIAERDQLEKERDFLVAEYERAIGISGKGFNHVAAHLYNAIVNARCDKNAERFIKLLEANGRLRKALEWYADVENYQSLSQKDFNGTPVISQRLVVVDNGECARKALKDEAENEIQG